MAARRWAAGGKRRARWRGAVLWCYRTAPRPGRQRRPQASGEWGTRKGALRILQAQLLCQPLCLMLEKAGTQKGGWHARNRAAASPFRARAPRVGGMRTLKERSERGCRGRGVFSVVLGRATLLFAFSLLFIEENVRPKQQGKMGACSFYFDQGTLLFGRRTGRSWPRSWPRGASLIYRVPEQAMRDHKQLFADAGVTQTSSLGWSMYGALPTQLSLWLLLAFRVERIFFALALGCRPSRSLQWASQRSRRPLHCSRRRVT